MFEEDDLFLDDFTDQPGTSPIFSSLQNKANDGDQSSGIVVDDGFGDDDIFEASLMEDSFAKQLQDKQVPPNVNSDDSLFKRPLAPLTPPGFTSTQIKNKEISKSAEKKRKLSGSFSKVWGELGKRKFPGPAGVMPRIAPDDASLAPEPDEEDDDEDVPQIPSSQQIVDTDLENCLVWERALTELDMHGPSALVNKYNTAWIQANLRNKAFANLGSKKMPFFLAKVKSVDVSKIDPGCILLDKQGEVAGSMLRQVLENYGSYIQPGSVVALKDVTVLVTSKTEYVIITLENIVSIYCPKQVAHLVRLTAKDLEDVASVLEESRRLQLSELASERAEENAADDGMRSQEPRAFSSPSTIQRSTDPAHHYRSPDATDKFLTPSNISSNQSNPKIHTQNPQKGLDLETPSSVTRGPVLSQTSARGSISSNTAARGSEPSILGPLRPETVARCSISTLNAARGPMVSETPTRSPMRPETFARGPMLSETAARSSLLSDPTAKITELNLANRGLPLLRRSHSSNNLREEDFGGQEDATSVPPPAPRSNSTEGEATSANSMSSGLGRLSRTSIDPNSSADEVPAHTFLTPAPPKRGKFVFKSKSSSQLQFSQEALPTAPDSTSSELSDTVLEKAEERSELGVHAAKIAGGVARSGMLASKSGSAMLDQKSGSRLTVPKSGSAVLDPKSGSRLTVPKSGSKPGPGSKQPISGSNQLTLSATQSSARASQALIDDLISDLDDDLFSNF